MCEYVPFPRASHIYRYFDRYRDIYRFSYRYRTAFLLTIYRAIDIPRYWLTLSHASKLRVRKMAEHLDFDKELLAKKWSYQIGHMYFLRTLARMRRRNGESYVPNSLEKSEKEVY